MITGGEQAASTIPLTTRELLAAILLYSEKDRFTERELLEHVANVRLRRQDRHLSSSDRVQLCLSGFVIDGVLRYDGASDRFFYERRNEDYLRSIIEAATMSGLRQMIANTAPQSPGIKTPIVLLTQEGGMR